MSTTRIHYRSDHRYTAGLKTWGKDKPNYVDQADWDITPPAAPGDIWLVRWGGDKYPTRGGPRAGYDICCPKCIQIHGWTTAHNCPSRRRIPIGDLFGYTCDHSGKSSCWNWTGSAILGTLSATPSLYSTESLGGCGWHGFLTNGELNG